MADVHVYLGMEALSMTAGQKNTLISGLRSLGQANNGLPFQRNHWRTRPDNNAVIFEGLFDENTITLQAIKNRLAAAFGISAALISHATQQTAYGLVITYTYQSVARLRMVAFGYNGGWSNRETSLSAALAYLADNAAAWAQTLIAAQPDMMPLSMSLSQDTRVSRAKGRNRIRHTVRQVVRSSAPVVKPLVAVGSIVFASIYSQERVSMEFLSALLALFPVVAVTAILIRYLVEAGKKYIPYVADNPALVQQVLNALAWLGLGVAAHFGVDGQVIEVIQKFTDAFPGIMGLLELVIPMFLSILATKGAHELAKKAEGSSGALPEPFRG